MSDHSVSRRYFFFGSLLAGAIPAAGFGSSSSLGRLGYKSPNEKLNIACIGAGGRANDDIAALSSENIVALVDPDSKRAEKVFKKYDKAPKYTDFRRMFDKEGSNIDAVLVAIPDHMHASAAMWAMERGKHVYCEKPLTRTIAEARMLAKAAEKYKVATQMGNQGYSLFGTRQAAEIVWSGEIGNVTEVHAWTNRPVWPQGLTAAPVEEKVPDTLDWDSWLGVAEPRAYSSAYLPFNWRGFYDFGCGALGDMACHILGPSNFALMLGQPTSVECISQEGKNPYTFPKKSVIRFDFPARRSMPAVKIYWYDGMTTAPPRPQGLSESELLGDLPKPRTMAADGTVTIPKPPAPNGSLFVGDKGFLTTGTYGAQTRLLPDSRMADYKFPPEILTRAPEHHLDWIRAAKGGSPASSDFSIAGPFTEWILLGVLSLRFEGRLEWDSAKMTITNNSEANKLVHPKFRKGWKLA